MKFFFENWSIFGEAMDKSIVSRVFFLTHGVVYVTQPVHCESSTRRVWVKESKVKDIKATAILSTEQKKNMQTDV